MALITSSLGLDVAICIFLGLLLLYFYMTRNFNYWKNQGVKEIPPIPFFGNIAQCLLAQKSPQQFILEAYRDAPGKNMIGFYIFDKPHVILRDPELIKHVFIKDFSNFSNKILTGNSTDVFGGNNLFLATNPPWKQIRQKLTSVFTTGKLKNMFELMLEICQDFDVYMSDLNIDDKIGQPVEMKELNAKLMTDIIGTTAFGMKFNSLLNPDSEFRKYGKAMFRSSYKRYLQMMAIFFVPSLRYITNAQFFDEQGSKFMRTSFWDVINERIRTGIKRPDLIDILMEIKKSQDNDTSDSYKLEGDALVAQAAVFFSGGFETTSTTVSFALYELAKNQACQKRLREEILGGLKQNKGKITYDMIMTLPYLNMVVHEAMRMYPVLPWLDRVPEEDYTFPGTKIVIKKNMPIILPARALQMDPLYFPDPEKFDPERFSEINRINIPPCTYFPFGEGPRNCVGSRLGLIQAKLALICFLKNYEVTFCPQTPIPIELDSYTVLTHCKGELYLNLRKIPAA